MTRIACLLAIFLGWAACKSEPAKQTPATTGSATDPFAVPEKKSTDGTNALKRPFLWKLEKDGKTSYALGTIHIGVDPNERLPTMVWELLDKSPTFAMETDIEDPRIADLLKCINCSLKKELGDEYWQKFEAEVGKPTAASLEKQSVTVATMTLAMKDMPMTMPMDSALASRAKSKGKKIVFLEDAMVQGNLLTKWMTAKALKSALDDIPFGKEASKKMLASYIAGDDPAIRASWDEQQQRMVTHGYSQAEADDQAKDMLFARNESWIPAIEKLHAEGGGFIAVGALHLVGPGNVLDLLTKKGFTVTRLTPGSGPN